MWGEAQQALCHLLQQEMPDVPPKPEKDRMAAAQFLSTLYVRYLQIFRSLELAYDQMTHPQKRRVVRLVLDGVMGRILELKNELVELEISEFHYFDDILQDLKMGPECLEIPIPKYFIKEKLEVLKERKRILSEILQRTGTQDSEMVGRLRAKFMKEIHLEEKRERLAKLHGEKVLDPEIAALLIQKVWQGYIQRKRTKQHRETEMIFLGMMPQPNFSKVSMAEVIARKAESLRCELQEQHEAEYQHALVQIKDPIRETESLDMKEILKEILQDQIRQWFIECRFAAELAAKEEAKEKKKKEKKKKEKGKKEKEKKSGKKEKDKSKGNKGKEEGWKMSASGFLPDITSANQTYQAVWQNREEAWNLHQSHDPELIREEKRKEVEGEVRVQVDELMRQELLNFKLAVDREKSKKKKRKKGGKSMLDMTKINIFSGVRKKRKGKKSGKRKKKDLTPNRTIDSLYEELITEGLLIKPKSVQLSDYLGESSYLGTTLRQADIEPMPSLSDVKQLLVLYGILPLGCESVHEKAPSAKTLLLAGPSGVGKQMIVNAICNETGANLFNLSAANIAGKYPGRSGLQMLLHMVLKGWYVKTPLGRKRSKAKSNGEEDTGKDKGKGKKKGA
ncbi:hypothetical protein XELAEV_18047275mg [Xenopus laevis]|uniref:ATPase AAA-type core domain-containing protein n=1 Tax=Xenopus laevis TaxID=8355 RepID=A0A974BV14_XENLA|nr:hypothetical protein XELAEV_18047275mg [Xenopus laevis]